LITFQVIFFSALQGYISMSMCRTVALKTALSFILLMSTVLSQYDFNKNVQTKTECILLEGSRLLN